MRRINKAGLDLLKSFEGCKLESYQDQAGNWTIGYGSTAFKHPEIVKGLKITQEQAEMYLQKDLEDFYHLDDYITEGVNDNQYSALICLAYNIGLRALKTSRLLGLVNNHCEVDGAWLTWDHINGVENPGLLRRRKAELELYNEV